MYFAREPHHVGQTVEILPAYEMDTGAQTRVDEITHCEATILSISGGFADVQIKNGGEYNVTLRRLRSRAVAL
jgi:hypothetical protein